MENKKVVRLTEADLHQLIENAVYNVLMENEENEGFWGGMGALAKGAGNMAQKAWNTGKQMAQNAANNIKTTYQQGSMTQDHQKIANQLQQWIQSGVFGNKRANSLASQLVNMLNAQYQQKFGQQGNVQNNFSKQNQQM